MRVYLSILGGAALFCQASWGALSIESVSGASGFTNSGSPTILGGMAGNVCTGNGIDGCDSCALNNCPTAPLCACNPARIYETLKLQIRLKRDAGSTGRAYLVSTANNTNTNIALQTPGNDGSFVDPLWGAICGAMPGGLTCENIATSGQVTLKIYIDKDSSNTFNNGDDSVDVVFRIVKPEGNNWDVFGTGSQDGVWTFSPYPGDEKVYLEAVEGSGGYPTMGYTAGAARITKIRVFMSDLNMTDAIPNGGMTPADLDLQSDGMEINNAIVDGLENGTTYAFRLGLVDEAQNIVQFFPPANTSVCDVSPLVSKYVDPTNGCPYAATPDQVLGLLTDDFNCFVATAAYGSSMEPKIKLFREFRQKILLPTKWGQQFVKSYYRFGPYAARFIGENTWLKPVARALLWPVYGFSWLSLKVGFGYSLLISLAMLATALALPLYGVRSRMKRA